MRTIVTIAGGGERWPWSAWVHAGPPSDSRTHVRPVVEMTHKRDDAVQRERLPPLQGERVPRERRLRRVVALGGGTGLPAVLTGLRRHLPARCRITAVVTVADDGGSSGILRQQYGVLPLGDIRNCLVALARVAPEVTAALQC